MTVESNDAIVIATLGDWLKVLREFFNQRDTKPKPIAPCTRSFSRALSKLQVIARDSDWFSRRSAPVAVGRTNYFSIGFSTVT